MAHPPQPKNQILARLPVADQKRLLPHLQAVSLPLKQRLYKAGELIDYAYFPIRGMLSAMTIMEDGNAIEVATIGREGCTGLMAALGGGVSPNEMIVQVAGDGLRMRAEVLKAEMDKGGPLCDLLLRYHGAFLVQLSYAIACNGLHPVQQRCCRWLLITHDRVGDGDLPLTHEFLGIMLGVQRSTVTEVLRPLQEKKLIACRRATIAILNRAGLEAIACECYQAVVDEFARAFP